jgi:hypothetical protein
MIVGTIIFLYCLLIVAILIPVIWSIPAPPVIW